VYQAVRSLKHRKQFLKNGNEHDQNHCLTLKKLEGMNVDDNKFDRRIYTGSQACHQQHENHSLQIS
jgi:hypothetical protein|tara:strand:+ start:382 stop:579 length:198 start_codon:yes stop_codon:yes gene_type:complete